MQDRVTYEYAIIRIVPMVEREEFFNVGVILFSKRKDYLDIRFKIDKNRLMVFSNDLEYEELNSNLKAWKLICEGDPKGGSISQMDTASRFRWLTATRSTVIQSSGTHPGLCFDPEKTLEDLFRMYVL